MSQTQAKLDRLTIMTLNSAPVPAMYLPSGCGFRSVDHQGSQAQGQDD